MKVIVATSVRILAKSGIRVKKLSKKVSAPRRCKMLGNFAEKLTQNYLKVYINKN